MVQEGLSRRAVLTALAVAAAGCDGRNAPPAPPPQAPGPGQDALEWAVAGRWRAADTREDESRRPLETLRFLQLRPGDTVIEIWPGAGWWSRILAPYASATAGVYRPAQFENGPGADRDVAALVEGYRSSLRARPEVYGDVRMTAFGRDSGPLAPPGTADLVFIPGRLHALLAAGLAEKAMRDAYAALEPAGRLGVLQPRSAPGALPDPAGADERLPQPLVVRLAEEAGFLLESSAPPIPGPDRMTLLFRKPAA